MVHHILIYIFFISIFFIVFVTFGYPLLLILFNLFNPKKNAPYGEMKKFPFVSIIISAYNEEAVIAQKLENSLHLDYPKEKLEIIVASDGSSDKTNEIVQSYESKGIRLYVYNRMGKTGIQNETVKKAGGEIIVFSDANAIYQSDAIQKLVRNFYDSRIGCVCGQLIYKKDEKIIGGVGENDYWNYEKFLKQEESRLSSLIGANGSIYAVRKIDYVELDPGLISDLVEPLEIVKRGKKVVYEKEAVSVEESSQSITEELDRKIRILTRSIQGILYMRCLFNPFRYGFFAVQLLIHKLFRYLIPIFLITGLFSLSLLTGHMVYYSIFLFTVILMLFGIIGKFYPEGKRPPKIFLIIYYYVAVNYAVMVAWKNIILKKKYLIWDTSR